MGHPECFWSLGSARVALKKAEAEGEELVVGKISSVRYHRLDIIC